eukprot:Gb_25387 [translate_table: standard]
MQLLPTPESPRSTNLIRKFFESNTPELSRLEPQKGPEVFPVTGVDAEHPIIGKESLLEEFTLSQRRDR